MKAFSKLVGATALAMLVTASLASAATLSVPSGSYPTITAAVAAAGSGDVIEVAPGTYAEAGPIDFNVANVTLRRAGSGTVTINAPASAEAVIRINAAGIILENVAVSRPTANNDWMRTIQAGSGGVTLTNCDISGPANGVGVILFNGADLTATGTTFGNFNTAASWASAVLLEGNSGDFSNILIDNCTFAANCNGWIRTIGGVGPKVGALQVTNTIFNATPHAQALRFQNGTQYVSTEALRFEDCRFTGTNLEVAEFHYTGTGGPASLTFRRSIFNAYNSSRRMLYLDIPCPIAFENVVFAGGQHETVLRFWGGPADVTFDHCTIINDGVTSATSASGTDRSTIIDGWDGGGRTFTLRNTLVYSPQNYTAALVGDPGSSANRAYSVSNSIIEHTTPTGANVTLTPGAGYSNAPILFVNAGARDYELQATSPAINSGANLSILTDVLGRPRPVGGAPDMGAYENQTVTSVPDWQFF